MLCLIAACAHTPERSVREHELQDSTAGTMVRIGETAGVIFRSENGWAISLDDVRRFELTLSHFVENVSLDDRADASCGVDRAGLRATTRNHVRQYVPVIAKNGRRQIHVNFVRRDVPGWKTKFIFLIDQGLRNFSVEYEPPADQRLRLNRQ
jgi:hypothetical protein